MGVKHATVFEAGFLQTDAADAMICKHNRAVDSNINVTRDRVAAIVMSFLL